MSKRIETENGLRTLKRRFEAFRGDPEAEYWISVVDGCIKERLSMDETDWGNTEDKFKALWRGLR